MGITRRGPKLFTYPKCRNVYLGHDPLPDCLICGLDEMIGSEKNFGGMCLYIPCRLLVRSVSCWSRFPIGTSFSGALLRWFHAHRDDLENLSGGDVPFPVYIML